jgi:predicted nucleotidyltransferase
MKIASGEIPVEYQKDIEKAISIFKKHGCREIYIFGSLAKGSFSENSDIDFAVKGLKKGDYYKVGALLNMEIEHNFDMIKLDNDNSFSRFIAENEVFLRVA